MTELKWTGCVVMGYIATVCVVAAALLTWDRIRERLASRQAKAPAPVREKRPGAGLWCLWCHPTPAGRAGRCGCTEKCGDVDHCIGDYTTLSGPEFTAQLEAMLRKEGPA